MSNDVRAYGVAGNLNGVAFAYVAVDGEAGGRGGFPFGGRRGGGFFPAGGPAFAAPVPFGGGLPVALGGGFPILLGNNGPVNFGGSPVNFGGSPVINNVIPVIVNNNNNNVQQQQQINQLTQQVNQLQQQSLANQLLTLKLLKKLKGLENGQNNLTNLVNQLLGKTDAVSDKANATDARTERLEKAVKELRISLLKQQLKNGQITPKQFLEQLAAIDPDGLLSQVLGLDSIQEDSNRKKLIETMGDGKQATLTAKKLELEALLDQIFANDANKKQAAKAKLADLIATADSDPNAKKKLIEFLETIVPAGQSPAQNP